MKKLLISFLLLFALTVQAQGTRPQGWYVQGNAGNGWAVNGVWNFISVDGFGETNAWFYGYTYIRWPGTNNGVNKTIWFRTGLDDDHKLYANGQLITNGTCCNYAYGAVTAKPGDIIKLEFYSYNSGGGDWVYDVAWNPDETGYRLLGSTEVSYVDSSYNGGGGWYESNVLPEHTTIINLTKSMRDQISGNGIYINQVGNYNNITILQEGNNNSIVGISQPAASMIGDFNVVDIQQGATTSGRNLIEFSYTGNNNNIQIYQDRNDDGTKDVDAAGNHMLKSFIVGNNNSISSVQRNNSSSGVSQGHFSDISIQGNNNIVISKQISDYQKTSFVNLSGNSNYVNLLQSGNAQHYIDLVLTGNGHTVNVSQTDSTIKKATINLTNVLGPSTLNLIQQGTISQQYNINQLCANLSGCSVTVTQGN